MPNHFYYNRTFKRGRLTVARLSPSKSCVHGARNTATWLLHAIWYMPLRQSTMQ